MKNIDYLPKLIGLISVVLVLSACGQTVSTPILSTPTTMRNTSTSMSTAIPSASMNPASSTSAVMGQMQKFEMTGVPFAFSYPATWLLNQDASTSVSLASPETLKMRQMYDSAPKAEGCATCEPNMVITYYPTIAEEPGNKIGRLGATSLSDLLKKDPNLKVLGTISVDNTPATEVDLTDMVRVYSLYIEKGKALYTVTFNNRANKSELSAEEKAILASLKLTPSTSTTPVVGSSMMKTTQ